MSAIDSTSGTGGRSHAEALGERLRAVIDDYRLSHPETDERDVDDALQLARAAPPRDYPAPEPAEDDAARRIRLVTVILAIFVILSMVLALILIRRP